MDKPKMMFAELETDSAAIDAFVTDQNARTAAAFMDTGYTQDVDRVAAILEDDTSLSGLIRRGNWLYTFRRTADNPKGLWQRRPADQPVAAKTGWHTVFDVDAFSETDGQDWHWRGAEAAHFNPDLVILSLSLGGSDQVRRLEFDCATGQPVPGGFDLGPDRGHVTWLDDDHLLWASARDDDATASGWPGVARRINRADGPDQAVELARAEPGDLLISPYCVPLPDGTQQICYSRLPAIGKEQVTILTPDGPLTLPTPPDTHVINTATHFVFLVKEQGGTPGTLMLGRIGQDARPVWTPKPGQVIRDGGVRFVAGWLLVVIYDNLQPTLWALDLAAPDAGLQPIDLPEPAELLWIAALDDGFTLDTGTAKAPLQLNIQGLLRAPVTYTFHMDNGPAGITWTRLWQNPQHFDPDGMQVQLCHAQSDDGTMVPYHLVSRGDGPAPTLIYGYGGFGVSLTPWHDPVLGALWLERGGAFAMTYIRGGGELGPNWHLSAKGPGRPRAYEDFAAIASDLAQRGVAAPYQIGCHGASNGGLLTGVMLTRYPDRFGAIWSSVGVYDMMRFHEFPAGRAWIDEYGDPEDPEARAWLLGYSPLHNVPQGDLPPALIDTSTNDDRVDPSHARRFAAALQAEGHTPWFYQHGGGHGGGGSSRSRAAEAALGYGFLAKTLGLEPNGATDKRQAGQNPHDPTAPANEREAATREILDLISRYPDDETPVFDAILHRAAHLCRAQTSGLNLLTDDATRIRYVRGWGPRGGTFQPGFEMDPDGPNKIAQSLRDALVINIPDLKDTDLYRQGYEPRRKLVDEDGVRSWLIVPLMTGSTAIGCITLSRYQVDPFDDADISLIETFAAQAVIAIANVRQHREVQTRLDRERASGEILHVISQSREDEAPVFEAIMRNAAALCHADMAALILGTRDDAHQTLAAHDRVPPQAVDLFETGQMKMDASLTYSARCIVESRLIAFEDMGKSDLYHSNSPIVRSMVDDSGIRSVIFVPLLKDGKALGNITLFREKTKAFSQGEIALVETFAAQAVIAIENVRQFREIRARLDRERASADILAVISQSRDDQAPVFETILSNAARLCDAPHAFLMLRNEADTHLEVAAHSFTDSSLINSLRDRPYLLADHEILTIQVLHAAKVRHIHDLSADPAYAARTPQIRLAVEKEGVRTLLFVPLLQNDKPIGLLGLFKHEVAPFSTDEITLVETFAAQAVIAIENARQFREVQNRLEREQASREVLEVISRSRDDDNPVFDVILNSAARLCSATQADLDLVDPDGKNLREIATWGDGKRAVATEFWVWPMDSDFEIVRSVTDGRISHVHDLRDTDKYRAGNPMTRAAVDDEGMRTCLVVPLISGGRGIGCIVLFRQEVRPFSDDEIALVQTFAAQAVIAIESARQFREIQDRLDRERATSEVLHVISESRADHQRVFETLLDKTIDLLDSDHGSVWLVSDDKRWVEVVARKEHGAEVGASFDRRELDQESSVAASVVRDMAVWQTDDLQTSAAYLDPTHQNRIWMDQSGARSMLAVPLVSEHKAIGLIAVYRRRVAPYTDEQLNLLQSFASQAVIAIENARQYRALADRTEEVQALNASLESKVADQVAEIDRMGRLKRFLSPQVADAIVAAGEQTLSSHRALIAALFCDIRGFTAFCESAEPEETIELLQSYHETLGKLVHASNAGFDHRSGDGIMVIFNDPIPCDDPAGAALTLALQMQEQMQGLCRDWRKLGHRLGFGCGIALGYATVGMVGFEGRYDYTASGNVVNLASRLCDHAGDQEILVSPRAAVALEDHATLDPAGDLDLKGFNAPVSVFRVAGLKQQA